MKTIEELVDNLLFILSDNELEAHEKISVILIEMVDEDEDKYNKIVSILKD